MNDRKVAIVHLFGELTELAAENETYYKGQFIIVRDEAGNVGLKVGLWDWLHQDKSAAPAFNDLPWFIPPADYGASKMNVFAIDNVPGGAYAYNAVTNTITITEARLKGKTGYPVFCTQMGGGVLRSDNITYDAVNGKVSINGFSLDDGEHVYIILPTGIAADPDYIALNTRVETLEKQASWLLAPFITPFGGMVLWKKPVILIPPGWKEVTDMAGRMPVGVDPSDPDFATVWNTGGAKSGKLTMNNLPELQFDYWRPAANGSATGNANPHPDGPLTLDKTNKLGKADPDAINLLNPYRIVDFIEPDPSYVP